MKKNYLPYLLFLLTLFASQAFGGSLVDFNKIHSIHSFVYGSPTSTEQLRSADSRRAIVERNAEQIAVSARNIELAEAFATANCISSSTSNRYVIQLDVDGTASVTASQFDAGSTGTISISSTTITDLDNIDCDDLGDHIITLNASDGSGDSSCDVFVTVQAYTTSATVSYSKSPNKNTICYNENVVFTANPQGLSSGETATYEWFVNNDSEGTGDTFTKSDWSGSTATVKVVMTVGSGSCAPQKEYSSNLTIIAAKPVDFTISGPSSICRNSSATYTYNSGSATNVSADATKQWYLNGSAVGGQNGNTFVVDNSSLGSDYTVSLEIFSTTPCAEPTPKMSAGLTTTVNPLPTLNQEINNPSVCANGQSSIELDDIFTSNGTITWHNSAVEATNGTGAIANTLVSPTAPKTYYLRSTLGTGCFITDEVEVNIDDLPTVSIGPDQAICIGESFDLSTNASATNLTYYTSQANANSGTSPISKDVSPTTTTTYYARAEDSGTGCYNTDSVEIVVNPLPTLTVNNGSVCANGQTSIDLATLVNSNGTETFYDTESNAISGSSSINSIVSPTDLTSYWVRTQLTTGCFRTGEIIISIDDLPTLTVEDGAICADSQTSIDLNTLVTTSGNTVSFHSSQTNADSGTAAINSTVSPTSQTPYYVRSSFSNGCYITDEITVAINPLPTFDVTPAEICIEDSIDLSTRVTNSGATDTLTYHTTQSNAESGSNPINATIDPSATTTYYIRSTSTAGCFTVKPVLITVASNVTIALESGNKDQNVCAGQGITEIKYKINNGGLGAGATVTASPGTGITLSGSYNSSTQIYTVIGTTTTAASIGTYNFTVTPVGCGAANATVQTGTIRIFNGTPATPIGLDNLPSSSFVICPASTETYEVTANPNVLTYNWTFPNGFTITSGAGTNRVTVNVSTSAVSGNVSVTSTNSCGTSTAASRQINIGSVSANAGPDQFICVGNTTRLNLAGSVTGVNQNKYGNTASGEWYWTDNGTGGTFEKSGGNDASYQNGFYNLPSGLTAGTVITLSIVAKKPSGTCPNGAQDDMKIFVRAIPTATLVSNGPICTGSTGSVTFSGTPNTTITFKVGTGTDQTIQLGAGNGTTANANFNTAALTTSTDIIIQSVAYTTNTACTNTYTTKPFATVVVNPLNTVTPGPTITVCQSETPTAISLTGASVGNGAQGEWTIESGGGTLSASGMTSNPASVTYTPAADYHGDVILRLTTNKPGECPVVSATRTITVNQAPTVFAGSQEDICQSTNPSAITLSGASVGGGNGTTTAAWSITQGGGSLSSTAQTANPSSVTYTPATNYFGPVTLTLTTNAPGVCTAVSSTRTFDIDELPTIETGTYGPVCQSGTPGEINLSGASVGGGNGATAEWSIVSGGGTLNPANGYNTSPQSASYTPAANYTGDVVLKLTSSTNGSCAAIEKTTTITVNQAPTVDAGPATATICAGESLQLNGNFGGSATSATWSSSSSNNGGFGNTTATTTTYTPSDDDIDDGTVTLTLTTSGSTAPCEPISDTIVVTINTPASLVVNGDTDICSDGSATIGVDLSGGSANSGTWTSSSNNNGGFANAAANSTSYTPSNADIANGSVTLTFTTNDPDNDGPCAAVSKDILINIYDKPFINVAPIGVGVCVSEPASFTVEASGDGLTYQWYKVDPNTAEGYVQLANKTDKTFSFPQTTMNDAGTYYVIVSGNAPCSSTSRAETEVVLNVNQDISIDTQPTAITECEGNEISFTVAASGSIDTYQWYKGNPSTGTMLTDGGDISGSNLNTLTISNIDETTDEGNYYVVISGTGGTCPIVTSNAVALNINLEPIVDAGEPQTICSDEFVTLAGSITAGATTGIWSGGSGSFSPNNTTLDAEYTPSAGEIANGSVVLTLTSTNVSAPCLEEADTVMITINPIPLVTVEAVADICSTTTSVPLTASFNGGASEGNWSVVTANAGSISGNNTFNPSASILSSGGDVELIYTTDDPAGPCTAVSETITFTINRVPVVAAGNDQTICSNANDVQLAGSVTEGSTTGIWTTSGDGSFSPNATTLNAKYNHGPNDISNGTVTLTLASTNAETPCADPTSSLTLTIEKLPIINSLSYSSATYCETDTGSFSPNPDIINGIGGIYSISPSVGSTNFNSTTGVLTPSGLAVGDYQITYTADRPSSCSATTVVETTTISISPKPDPTFSYSKTAFCSNESNPVPNRSSSVAYSGATYSASNSGLKFVSGSPGTIDLATSTPGTYSITYSVPAIGGCEPVSHTVSNIIISKYVNPGTISGYTTDDLGNNSTVSSQLIACHLGKGKLTSSIPAADASAIIQWEYSEDLGIEGSWIPISNTAGNRTLDFDNLTSNRVYRILVSTGSGCPDNYSEKAYVSVIPPDLKPTPVSASPQEFCLGGTSNFVSSTNYGQDQLNQNGGFNTGQLNTQDPNSWLVDGKPGGWTASSDNEKANNWSGTNDKTFNGINYNSTPASGTPDNKKFAIVSGNTNENTSDPLIYGPYGTNGQEVLISTLETPIFSLQFLPNATLDLIEAYNIRTGGAVVIEISTSCGTPSVYNTVYRRIDGPANTDGKYIGFQPLSIDLSDYYGNPCVRVKFTMVREQKSAWAMDGITLPGGGSGNNVQWTDQFSNVISTQNTVAVTPPTPGYQIYTVTSYVNGCSGDPEAGGSVDVDLTVDYSYAGKDIPPATEDCGQLVKLNAYDNTKSPFTNYIEYLTAGQWDVSMYGLLDGNNDGKWDIANSGDSPVTYLDAGTYGGIVFAGGNYKDYGPTNKVGTWSISSGPTNVGVADWTNVDPTQYFTSSTTGINAINDPKALFNGPSGQYTLTWTVNGCPDDVVINVLSCDRLDWDGVNDHVVFGDVHNLTNSFSLEVWVRPGSQSQNSVLISKRVNGNGYSLEFSGNNPVFNMYNGGTTSTVRGGGYIVGQGKNRWHHIAVTYDGSELIMFVDGIRAQSVGATAGIGTNTASFIFGAMSDGAGYAKNFYHGWMDEVRIWGRALTQMQIQEMMNQEINNDGGVRGSITNQVISGLAWGDLLGYYQMNVIQRDHTPLDCTDTPTAGNDIISGYLQDNAGTDNGAGKNGKLRFITTQQDETAPLPYTTKQNGDWNDINTWTNSAVWEIPNSKGLGGSTDIDWNIAVLCHDVMATGKPRSNPEETNIDYVLGGLVSLNGKLTVIGTGANDETNNGLGLWVTHYLKLDGVIDLIGESQLVQKRYNSTQTIESELDPSSSGYLERDQQGQTNYFNYNYFSAPVNNINSSVNNGPYTVASIMKDGTNSANPLDIGWVTGSYDASGNTNPIGNSARWIYMYPNAAANTYLQWVYLGQDGSNTPGLGFTLKGSGVITKSYQNYVFIGKPNNADINLTLGAGKQTLAGNPYPSAISLAKFIPDNEGVIDGNVYFWEHFSSNNTHVLKDYQGGYAIANNTGGVGTYVPNIDNQTLDGFYVSTTEAFSNTPGPIIPVGQGFFVNASGGGNINFNNDQRIFYREDGTESVFMRSRNPNNNGSSQVDVIKRIRIDFQLPNNVIRPLMIGFVDNPKVTDGYDFGYDARTNDSKVPADVFWKVEDENCLIQGVNNFDITKKYPLTVIDENGGSFNLRMRSQENFEEEVEVYLYDALLETYSKINDISRKFSTDGAKLSKDRFYIAFRTADQALEIPKETIEKVFVNYLNDSHEIMIKTPSDISVKQIYLINIAGQTVKSWNATNTTLSNDIRIPVTNISDGNYIIKLETDKTTFNKKVIIKE